MQLAIDGCKKTFVVDPNEDIKRIRKQPCMNREKDYPYFMKYTHEISITKNGKERPKNDVQKDRHRLNNRIDPNIVCPMNWLEERLDKIQGASKKGTVDTWEYLVKTTKPANNRQMTKIRKIVEEYDTYTKYCMAFSDDDMGTSLYIEKTKEVLDALMKIKINLETMRRLIETSLGYDGCATIAKRSREATKYTRKMLNLMYRYDSDKFLSCFKKSQSTS